MEQEMDQVLPDDAFDLAFNTAAGADGVGAAAEGSADEKQDVTADDVVKPDLEADAPVVVDEGEDTPEEKPEPKVEEKLEEKPAPKVEDKPLEQKRPSEAELQRQAKADEQAAKAAEEREAAQKKAREEAAAKAQPTDEEKKLLEENAEFLPDLPKILEASKRMVMASVENLLAQKLEEFTKQLDQRLAPVVSTAQTYARNEHERTILSVHADAFTILPEVEKWVEGKPAFMQRAYNEVLDKGSAAEINELFSLYKTETSSGKESPSVTPTPEETARKAAKKKQLQSLEGVRSRQSAQKSGIDEDDFESAFKATANS